jgi:chromosome partitioning protein
MAVISLFSPKGGAGKTTTAILLATALVKEGFAIKMIDADPNGTLSLWPKDNGAQSDITIIQEHDDEAIMTAIKEAHDCGATVIVDLDGRASTRATHAILMSDLVLIPFRGSIPDADLAAKAQKMIENLATARGRAILYRGILTNTPANRNFYSRELVNVLKVMEDMAFPMLMTHLAERQAYRALFSFGGTLDGLDPREVPSLIQARTNADALAAEVIDLLAGGK